MSRRCNFDLVFPTAPYDVGTLSHKYRRCAAPACSPLLMAAGLDVVALMFFKFLVGVHSFVWWPSQGSFLPSIKIRYITSAQFLK